MDELQVENTIKIDDLEVPPCQGNLHIYTVIIPLAN